MTLVKMFLPFRSI